MRRPRIRGIRLRLALALLVVVAGSLGVVYLIVVPSLENELINAKLNQLEADATESRAPLRDPGRERAGVRRRGGIDLPGARRRLLDPAEPAVRVRRLEHGRVTRRRARSDRARGDAEPHDRARHRRARRPPVRRGGGAARERGGRDPAQRLARRSDRKPEADRAQAPVRGSDRPPLRRASPGTWSPRCTRSAFCGSSGRPSGSRAGASTSRWSTRATTSSETWPTPSSGCEGGSANSTARAASSSPTPRTSCARRSSRSAASSS